MNPPRIIKRVPRSAQVAFHHAKSSTRQSKVTAGFESYFQKLITPEGQDDTHEFLFVEPEFIMGNGGSPDSTIEVSIGAENCPAEDVFGALLHESKPNKVKGRKKRDDGRWAPYPWPYIHQQTLVQAAGKQAVGRLLDETNWETIKRTGWSGAYASSGIGEWFALFRRRPDDDQVYHIYRNPGSPALRERLIPDIPEIGRQYLTSFWTRIQGDDFFETAYSSAGQDIMDQTLQHEVAFNEMAAFDN